MYFTAQATRLRQALKRDVVVEVHRRFVRRRRCRGLLLRTGLCAAAELVAALRLLRLTPTALLLAAACRCAAALTAAQHLQVPPTFTTTSVVYLS